MVNFRLSFTDIIFLVIFVIFHFESIDRSETFLRISSSAFFGFCFANLRTFLATFLWELLKTYFSLFDSYKESKFPKTL
jgi:predicted membrane protein